MSKDGIIALMNYRLKELRELAKADEKEELTIHIRYSRRRAVIKELEYVLSLIEDNC